MKLCPVTFCPLGGPEYVKKVIDEKVIDVILFRTREQLVSPKFKPMVTLGLAGSIASVIVTVDNNFQNPTKVIFSNKSSIDNIISDHIEQTKNYYVFIKTPGKLVKKADNKYYTMEAIKNYDHLKKNNVKLFIEPYSMSICEANFPKVEYDSTMHVIVKDGALKISNDYKYISIPLIE